MNKTESPCANSKYSQCLNCFSYLLPAVHSDSDEGQPNLILNSISRKKVIREPDWLRQRRPWAWWMGNDQKTRIGWKVCFFGICCPLSFHTHTHTHTNTHEHTRDLNTELSGRCLERWRKTWGCVWKKASNRIGNAKWQLNKQTLHSG